MHTEFKFHPQVTQIGAYWGEGGHTELYLFEGDQLAIMDTGCSDTPERYIAPALEAMDKRMADIDVIINTHGHHDHAGGNAPVVDASGAQVWISEHDARIAEDPDYQFERYFAQNDTMVGRPDRLEASLAKIREQAYPSKVDRRLKDGDVLGLGKGISLRVIACPGHTEGSLAFMWEREGMLFTGDSILGAGSREGGMPLIYMPEHYERTLDHLEELDFGTLCLGHHYRALSLPRESVKYGELGKACIGACREIAHILAEAMQQVLAREPQAEFLPAARQAVAIIDRRMPLRLDPETGLPAAGGVAALYSNWQRFRAKQA
ncbi:MAG: MBL fold metallo-hydrolase [Dehalococcoidales bacterium]|nr:MBL fold metallo-hydrolase [Dehalococcoidales bacterium]